MVGLFEVARRPLAGQAVRFGAVGLANFATSFVVLATLRDGLACPVWLASAVGFLAGMIQGFALNRWWTFAAVDHSTPLATQAASFAAVSLFSGGIFAGVNDLLSRTLPLLASSVVAMAVATPLSFVLNRWFVFRGRSR